MAHISTGNAPLYSQVAYTSAAAAAGTDTVAEFQALSYATSLSNVESLPEFGNEPTLTAVNRFGSKVATNIETQGSPNEVTFTISHIPSVTATIEGQAGDNIVRGWRFRLIADATVAAKATPVAADEHSDYFILGSISSVRVSTSLTGSSVATITIAASGDWFGPATTTT